MNVRRGMIRVWVFASAIWIAGVVVVAMDDPNVHWADRLSAAVPVAAGPVQPNPAAGAPNSQAAKADDWIDVPAQGRATQASPIDQFDAPAAPHTPAEPPTFVRDGPAKPSPAASAQAAEANPFLKYVQQPTHGDENPYSKYVQQPQPPAPAAKRFATGLADPVASLPSAIWKYVSVALGVPIILLVLGAGVGWMAIGFKSDVPPRIVKKSEIDSDATGHPSDLRAVWRYILGHWRGEQGLLRSSLFNGALFYFVLFITFVSLGQVVRSQIFSFAGMVVFLLWMIWASVGIFRCGTQIALDRTSATGPRIGGVIAMIGVLLVAFFSVKDVFHLLGLSRYL